MNETTQITLEHFTLEHWFYHAPKHSCLGAVVGWAISLPIFFTPDKAMGKKIAHPTKEVM